MSLDMVFANMESLDFVLIVLSLYIAENVIHIKNLLYLNILNYDID